MAESLSQRLNEYLKNGPTVEGINSLNCASSFEVNQDVSMISVDRAGQRDKNHDRRSSITSFADLYERAVRNVLSIRPLFDSTLDIFAQRPEDGNLYPQQNQHQINRTATRAEKIQCQDRDEVERASQQSIAQNILKSKDSQAVSLNLRPSMPDRSANRFFTQVLAEHVRHTQPRIFPMSTQRLMLHSSHSQSPLERYSGIPARSEADRPSGQMKAQFHDDTNEKNKIQFSNRPGKHSKHKPGMLDSLKHLSRQHDYAELKVNNLDENSSKNSEKTYCEDEDVDSKAIIKPEIQTNDNPEEIQTKVDNKNVAKSDLDLLKERLKENARLKYRPYSLRSKKTGLRKTFAGGKRKKQKKIKKKKLNIITNLSCPQEVFLLKLGLIRKQECITTRAELAEDTPRGGETSMNPI